MMEKISSFQGNFRFLSNFYPADVEFEGMIYPTVEHAYQAAKTLDFNERKRISGAITPGMAKRMGRQLAIRKDWNNIKLEVMEKLVYKKFSSHKHLMLLLLDTKGKILEEGNNWKDRFWGVDEQGNGLNHLGKILMKVRGDL